MRTLLTSIFRRRAGAAALAAALVSLSAAAVEPAGAPAEPLAAVQTAAEKLVRSELHEVSYAVHVQAAGLDPRLHLVPCPAALAATLAPRAELGPRVAVRVSCPAPAAPWAVYVPVNIESDLTVLVLRQSVLRGARLAPAQVAPETRRIAGLAVGYVTDVASLEHRSLARSLPAGTALTADALLADVIVHQGQEVTLVASGPGISVRAAGKALQDGREGARVRAQNLVSLRIVEGVVDASGVIEITP
ncbi:MAG: flagellar basal body P-ring formation protein FlgA [Gammaproteobacteria bacterium]|nr:flagellar basal body P-ring formation protein FlgA [Gammaproteobacteria bacterium]